MSEENVEIVRRIYEASAERDVETVLSLYDPEIEWDMSQHPYGQMFEAQSIGHDGLRAWFREWYEVFDDFAHQYEELLDRGEHVISVGVDTGRGRGSGIEVKRTLAACWTVRDGKVVRVVWFRTRAEALQAAGLSE